MEKEIIFGCEWDTEIINPDLPISSKKCTNNIGVFYSLNLYDLSVNPDDYYKIISLIHEKYIFEKPYYFVSMDSVAIMKNNFPDDKYCKVTYSTIEDCLSEFPTSFGLKQERALKLLYKKYPEHGSVINFTDTRPFCFFSKAKNDFSLIIKNMVKKELIEGIVPPVTDDEDDCDIIINMQIAPEGWEFIENNFSTSTSKQGFIAMWFNPKMSPARSAIKNAIEDTKFYTPRIIDEKQFNGDIPEEISIEISKSKFLVADLTGQRGGVYFEAGYAIAKKIPVIFTCKEAPEEKVHFDINHNNIIFWTNENELYTKLLDRIKGTIS